MTDIIKSPGRAIAPVLMPTNFDQLVKFAELASLSDLAPKDYRGKPANIMLAVQMGSELGLTPMQSLLSIAVINGRPGVYGDGLMGLCRQSPLCEDITETLTGEGDDRTATCVAKRRGSTAVTHSFSMFDAKRAGLAGKAGPWTQYPDRMLTSRARGFALRDAFADVLRGLKSVEELMDTPVERFQGTTITSTPARDDTPAPRRAAAVEIPKIDTSAPDRALAWVEARIAKIKAALFVDELTAMEQDGKLFHLLTNLRDMRPELFARYEEAMRFAKETLTEVEGGE